jgi:hypothetical protein
LSSRVAASLLAVFLAAGDLHAGEPIDTDGPDFVESSEVVGKGRFQFEANAASERDRRDGIRRTTTSTPTLLRFGVTDTVEIRLETEGRIQASNEATGSEASSSEVGNADYALGVKWHSHDRNPALATPAVSWIAHFDTPTGSRSFKGHGTRPSLRSVLTWDLPDDLALGIMPGLKYDATPDGRRFVSATFGAVLNRRWTEHLRTFVESASPQIASSRDGGVLMSWTLGAAYLVANDWQIGVRQAKAANRNTPNSQLLFELAGRY